MLVTKAYQRHLRKQTGCQVVTKDEVQVGITTEKIPGVKKGTAPLVHGSTRNGERVLRAAALCQKCV